MSDSGRSSPEFPAGALASDAGDNGSAPAGPGRRATGARWGIEQVFPRVVRVSASDVALGVPSSSCVTSRGGCGDGSTAVSPRISCSAGQRVLVGLGGQSATAARSPQAVAGGASRSPTTRRSRRSAGCCRARLPSAPACFRVSTSSARSPAARAGRAASRGRSASARTCSTRGERRRFRTSRCCPCWGRSQRG